jgi:hypothetical protein
MSITQARMIFDDIGIGRVWSGSNDGAAKNMSVDLMLREDFDMSSRH